MYNKITEESCAVFGCQNDGKHYQGFNRGSLCDYHNWHSYNPNDTKIKAVNTPLWPVLNQSSNN